MNSGIDGLVRWVDFAPLGDERGELVSIEGGRNIPFPVRRVYYIYSCRQGVSRGFHAHRALRQVAICISGSCKMLLDNGRERAEATLDSPLRGLLIEGMMWREMHEFSPNCVLLVLADQHYDESDYIRSYEGFLEVVNAEK
ncbi:MAG: dTDP-6-deoxy-3,4-keto-hexulose isomerase [Alteromonadaceae bacterium]|nr:dTDP-6-deoxy-3,4-keto-hexulose isomerase [Alteromonadaceae bacterium]MBH85855.1 dTDP-6-deoxy-3,4-keto-hexulose isomerase [Alteromonadaceae bacterium]|tara:strand:- start:119728 stop:120150 length:423 start_codon:yes stop_codon:yes gene_type:complete